MVGSRTVSIGLRQSRNGVTKVDFLLPPGAALLVRVDGDGNVLSDCPYLYREYRVARLDAAGPENGDLVCCALTPRERKVGCQKATSEGMFGGCCRLFCLTRSRSDRP